MNDALQTHTTDTANVDAGQLAQAEQLKQQWKEFHQRNPKTRIRDAARLLDSSEAELVASGCGNTAVRLKNHWADIIKDLETLGEVMALTRNDNAVHEKTGQYQNIRIMGNIGLVLDPAIDLRLFLNHWHSGYAVEEPLDDGGVRQSLQFFDIDGQAIHKVYMTENSDQFAYRTLVGAYTADDQTIVQRVFSHPAPPPERADAEIDVDGFRTHWKALQDTHDFYELLKTFGVSRLQGLRLGGEDLARRVDAHAYKPLLETAAEKELSIMVFVGSPGVVQIHTGPIHMLWQNPEWFNILDPGFNLHLRTGAVDSSWVVRKPTVDGDVHSLECYDSNGKTIMQLFGARKPGQAEDPLWRELVTQL